MEIDDTVEMLAFNLKMVGGKTKKNILISAGSEADKAKLLDAVRALASLPVALYATHGTSRFLKENGIDNFELFKIAETKEPNIRSFLGQDRFDLVINILTGDKNKDEADDNALIRSLCVEHGIPLITDPDVAVMTLERMEKRRRRDVFKYKIADPKTPWDLRKYFLQTIADKGGFACYHAHFDKAYLITPENLKLSQVDMQKKWDLYKHLKESYTPEDLIERISRGLDKMIEQGVTCCRSNVDVDSTVGLMCLEAALEVREQYRGRIHFQIALQPLQGLLEKSSRDYFAKAAERADLLGGLPSRDRPYPEKHLDYLMGLAKDLGKRIDAHIDQENNPDEDETELLARKAIEHGLEGRVAGVHAISLASKPEAEQDRIISLVKEAGMPIIVCPSAALSMKPLPKLAPLHNSIAPVEKLLQAGVKVYMGVDNIHDLFMPLVDGDMWYESRTLMEACRFYDIDKIAEIASDKSGFGQEPLAKAA